MPVMRSFATTVFTTYDRDNDQWNNPAYHGNCAISIGGGFWYNDCSCANVNAVRRRFNWGYAEHL